MRIFETIIILILSVMFSIICLIILGGYRGSAKVIAEEKIKKNRKLKMLAKEISKQNDIVKVSFYLQNV